MPNSINVVILSGNLGRDAEVRHTTSGTSVATFSIAVTHSLKKDNRWEDQTSWVNITVWKPSDYLIGKLVKGAYVTVHGRIQTRSFEDKNGQKRTVTEIVAEQIL